MMVGSGISNKILNTKSYILVYMLLLCLNINRCENVFTLFFIFIITLYIMWFIYCMWDPI